MSGSPSPSEGIPTIPFSAAGPRLVEPQPGRKADRLGDATRFLSAAVYQDESFADRVHEVLFEERHRAIATSPGVDLPTVLRHCLAARQHRVRRDVLLLLVLAATLIGAALWTAARPREPVAVPVVLGAAAAWLLVLRHRWMLEHGRIAETLRRSSFDADPLGGGYGNAVRQIEQVEKAQAGNVTVYSGFSPFIGSGSDLDGWSFTVDVETGKATGVGARGAPAAFDLVDLYRHVEASLLALSIPGLSIQDRVFVHGTDVRDDPRFLADPFARPSAQLSASEVRAVMDDPSEKVRHYQCIRVVNWSGELVLSAFFRLARSGKSLFAEASFFLLTPLRDEYRSIDDRGSRCSPRQLAALLIETTLATPFLTALAPFRVLSRWRTRFAKRRLERDQRREIREHPAWDYGARVALRETAAAGVYRRYFQKLDKEMHFKLIQRQLLDALCDFLDAHGIDTSELRDRQAVIYNSGVIVSGGTIQAETMTVGERARSVRKILRRQPSQSAAHPPTAD